MALHDELLRRLMTDWRREDGATKAGEVLEEMDYPSLVSVLPYRHFDAETGMFVNNSTVGFILECTPLIGANDSIVDALDNFLRNKLPRERPLSILLLGSKCVSDMLDTGLADMAWKGSMRQNLMRSPGHSMSTVPCTVCRIKGVPAVPA
ncbi:TraC family protein [Pantoea stewartii]